MNTTVPMPAWLRKIQQGWAYQAVILPAVIGFGGSLMLQGCLIDGIDNISRKCAMAALNGFLISLFTSFLKGHSPGSASFASNGDPIPAAVQIKEMADNVVKIQTKASDPTIPSVTQAMADAAQAKLNSTALNVAMNNQIVKTALANEAK